jgi:SAM-dependent methyltransferase
MDRRTKLVGLLDVARQEGIEIGPLTHPVVDKGQGRIFYADHASIEELKQKYASDTSVEPERMVPLDAVIGIGTLAEAVDGRTFDYAVASHVIEHVPDLIGFLRDVADVLRSEGFLCLAIPDKRYTFDRPRGTTVLADVIEAHLLRLRRPSIRQVFDHFATVRPISPEQAWSGLVQDHELARAHTMEDAWRLARLAVASERYVDCHCHVFTPTSFCDVLRGCFELDLLDFKVVQFWSTAPNEVEFFVTLRRLPPGLAREVRRNVQLDSLPPPEVTSRPSANWQPGKGPGFLIGSRHGGFDGRIFYVQSALRYWVTAVTWAQEAGFEWPADIVWASDDDIAAYSLVPGPPPSSGSVRAWAASATYRPVP